MDGKKRSFVFTYALGVAAGLIAAHGCGGAVDAPELPIPADDAGVEANDAQTCPDAHRPDIFVPGCP